jgi:periplasmic protein TonB
MNSSPKRSALISALLHAAAILLVLAATSVRLPPPIHPKVYLVRPLEIAPDSARRHANAGGGGGQRETLPPSRGDMARRAVREFVAPLAVIQNDQPEIAIEPAILGDPAPRTYEFPQLGDPRGAIGPASGGPGSGNGIGNGKGGGIGDHNGPGMGIHDGSGVDGDAIGSQETGRITAPVALFKPEPEYSEDGRKAKLQGIVTLRIEIDERGLPRLVAVRQGLGLGLDEKAVEAVKRWRFRPATRNGKPVAASALVEVAFRLL